MVAIVVEGKRDVTFFNSFISKVLKEDKNKSKLLDAKLNLYQDLKNDINVGRISKVLFILDSDNIKDNNYIGGYENSDAKIKSLIT